MTKPIIENVQEQDDRLKIIEEKLKLNKNPKEKKFTIKLPRLLSRSVEKDADVSVALTLEANHDAQFQKAEFKDGLIYVGDQSYAYEESSIYRLRLGKKRLPFIVVLTSRLTPVGGKAEEYRMLFDTDNAMTDAETLKITNFAQRTIIRRLEQEEVDYTTKKKAGVSIILWVVVAGVVLYIITKMFGG